MIRSCKVKAHLFQCNVEQFPLTLSLSKGVSGSFTAVVCSLKWFDRLTMSGKMGSLAIIERPCGHTPIVQLRPLLC